MRIGLFSDSYHPVTNGITLVVDIIKNNLEALGHDVYICAPMPLNKKRRLPKEDKIVRLPALSGIFFYEQSTSFFFPPRQLSKIKKLDLDVIVIFTPAQVGLFGAYCATKLDIPLVSHYSTDLVEYIKKYPYVISGAIALFMSTPFALKLNPREMAVVAKLAMSNKSPDHKWSQHMVKEGITMLHNKCQAVIAVSPKSHKELEKWGTKIPIHTIATGVDCMDADPVQTKKFKLKHGINNTGKNIMYLGRVAKEKNIDTLIDAMPYVLKKHSDARLLVVGDFGYRKKLEEKVEELGLDDKITFCGKVPINERWSAFASADIFCFPSLTDTQALVINEAAGSGLPTVWCDPLVNEVLVDRQSGLLAKNTPKSIASKIADLIDDPILMKKIAHNARLRSKNFNEISQTKKLEKVLKDAVDEYHGQ